MEEIFNNQSLDNNTLLNLKFKFSMSERFIHAKNEENKYFQFQTPFLKVLKPIYLTYNKKKSISKKYLILETTHEIDFNNEIDDFIYTINKIHEVSQENIKEKSLIWFKTEFDDIGLDMKVKRPIDQQKNSEFIKICLPSNNSELEEKVSKLNKGDYILCNLQFKGLKVSAESIVEEVELVDFVTQLDFDDYQKEEYIDNLLTEDVGDLNIPDGYEKLVLNNNTTDVIIYEEKKEQEENKIEGQEELEENKIEGQEEPEENKIEEIEEPEENKIEEPEENKIEETNIEIDENIKHIEIKKVNSKKTTDSKKINKKSNYVRKISKKIIFT
jgi:hypothetical protein